MNAAEAEFTAEEREIIAVELGAAIDRRLAALTWPRWLVAWTAVWLAGTCLWLAQRMPARRKFTLRDQWFDGSLTVDRLSSAD
jgi:hypothetical protein